MNIFILSTDPVEAAVMQCDQHVIKMVLETAQILSTIAGGPYKPTHQNHPCVLWAAQSAGNYQWLVAHGRALCAEYTYRYGKTHKSQAVIEILANVYKGDSEQTPFVQCMPEELRGTDPVDAYRRYYRTKTFAVWRHNRPAPSWFNC